MAHVQDPRTSPHKLCPFQQYGCSNYQLKTFRLCADHVSNPAHVPWKAIAALSSAGVQQQELPVAAVGLSEYMPVSSLALREYARQGG